MGKLQEKIAVITGSSAGLGLGIAQAYAREGAKVVITSRNEKRVQAAVDLIVSNGGIAVGIPGDAGELSDLIEVLDYSISEFGGMDIWVNNAGISPAFGPTMDIEHHEIETVIRTNILGVYYGSMLAVRHFAKQGSGKLINMLGRGYKKPVPMQNAYGSSKSWLYSFTLALAEEYNKSSFGIYAFSPGMVDTDMLRKIHVVEGYESRIARLETVMRMWSNPPEVPAESAVWIASEETDGKTGLVIKTLTTGLMLKGVLGEVWRKLRGINPEPINISVTSVPPVMDNQDDTN